MKVNLEEINALLSDRLDEQERRNLVDKVLSDPESAKAFRAFHQLDQKMKRETAAKKQPVKGRYAVLRYALGAAAVLFMAVYPYFTSCVKVTLPKADFETAALTQIRTIPNELGVLQKVAKVNVLSQAQNWGQTINTLQLVDLQNRSQ